MDQPFGFLAGVSLIQTTNEATVGRRTINTTSGRLHVIVLTMTATCSTVAAGFDGGSLCS